MKPCPWYKRLLHQWLRSTDLDCMLPSIQDRVEARLATAYSARMKTPGPIPPALDPFHPDYLIGRDAMIQALWQAFIHDRGQEHWHCTCSRTHPTPLPGVLQTSVPFGVALDVALISRA